MSLISIITGDLFLKRVYYNKLILILYINEINHFYFTQSILIKRCILRVSIIFGVRVVNRL